MTSKADAKKFKVTVFLIKDGYSKIEDFFSVKDFKVIAITSGAKEIGTLIYKGGFQSRPGWVSIFDGVQGFDSKGIWNQSSKAIFILEHEGRWFCFTFGYARHIIDELAYERNFGLIVSLNLGDPSGMKSIDKTNVGHVSLRSREQATREIALSSFEFNDDIDLLRSVTAKLPKGKDEDQETVSGRDSVTIYTTVTVDAFEHIAKRLYAAFKSTSYKKRYPWLGKIREERDKQVVEALDAALVAKVVKEDFAKIWLAIPELVVWEEIRGFAFKYRAEDTKKAGAVLYQDLDIEAWRKVARIDANLTADQLKHKKIFVYWEDDRDPSTWNVYRCLNAEIDLTKKKYILNDGDWYNLETNFVQEVNDFYDSVPNSKIQLPPYGTNTEPKYLKVVAAGNAAYALMDRKEVMIGGGRSRVEFCDLYSSKREIIHVKTYGGSSLLSHLFSQALVSGNCFLHDSAFRVEVNKLLPQGFKLASPKDRPAASDYEVCIAVMSRVKGPLELPFFSKVSLMHAVRSLRNSEYRVTKLKISQ
ncbi:MAG: TIGR04141 family sporadically distributed protein [Betaproteobacteria bacterium]|nr:TIGR04141 family sporadically distributed protein [Betaproteobacteria bacterium]